MPTMIQDPDSLTWGRLVKSWATGLDYLNTPPGQQPPPAGASAAGKPWALPPLAPASFNATVGGNVVQKTIPGVLYLTKDDCNTLLGAAGIPAERVTYPPETTEVIIVQGDAKTMVIRLPPTKVLQTSEANLLGGGAYPTPAFYEPLFSPPGGPVKHANPPQLPNKAGIMDLHANRIGDYTMGLCA
ncbi:MAG: hypothetical protein K2X72_06060 [Reyranella sp.]|nr:hypothetical protein [Reyranella sp.]